MTVYNQRVFCGTGNSCTPAISVRFVFSLFIVLFSVVISQVSYANPSISRESAPSPALLPEIKKIILQKALQIPSIGFLDRLSVENLEQQLHAIDSHARYIPPPLVTKNTRSRLHLGLEIFQYDSHIWVMADPKGPASLAGVPEVGQLLGVNNVRNPNRLEQVTDLLDTAIQRNKVVLDVYDPDTRESRKYTVVPDNYAPPSISVRTTGKYVFLHLTDFVSHETAPLFFSLYKTLKRPGLQILIDLRGCPGGDLYEALEIAGMFLHNESPLVTTYDRTGKVHSYTAPPGTKLPPPDYVLIDDRTASAAEILAGIFKSIQYTQLVGIRSYGKCESQTVFNLSNGGQLWLTTLAIRFPDGMSCTDIGIQPDIPFPDISITDSAEIAKVMKYVR